MTKVQTVYLSDADKNKAAKNNAGKSINNNRNTQDIKITLGNQSNKKGKAEKSSKKSIAKVTNNDKQQSKQPQLQKKQGNNSGLIMQPLKGDSMPQTAILTKKRQQNGPNNPSRPPSRENQTGINNNDNNENKNLSQKNKINNNNNNNNIYGNNGVTANVANNTRQSIQPPTNIPAGQIVGPRGRGSGGQGLRSASSSASNYEDETDKVYDYNNLNGKTQNMSQSKSNNSNSYAVALHTAKLVAENKSHPMQKEVSELLGILSKGW
eukprot:CAMPEP_0119041948 /NCGR_PEP_ID=MMETSP1177-20130426/14226_1 /TAXON_ID=2985 /ORGANISM="Ochromonas sp, Strain CCMP1899" /LENGTH=265 /DNA_ID=CAMNT_0007008383 /DNA_START=105 /DNA_END=899 /DNA_ORIENTATION=+